MRFSFIHAADLHLDSPLRGLGASGLAETVRDATLQAFDAVVARAIAVEAAFVVLAGDLYDGPEHGLRAQLRFQSGLERLSAHGIRTFIAHGNHDPRGGRWRLIRRWPEGVHVFAVDEPETVPVTRADRLLARVHGVSYGRTHEHADLSARFPQGAPDVFDVAVLHCNVGELPDHGNYAPCSLDGLLRHGMDYWALGHVHRHTVLSRDPAWVVYPGCTQGRGFGRSEVGAKGAVQVDVEGGRVAAVTPFATDQLRFLEVPIDLTGLEDIGEVQRACEAAAMALRHGHPEVRLVVRGVLSGRGTVHARLRDRAAREDLLAELGRLDPGLTWTSLEDTSAPALDLEALRAGDDLRGALFETVDAWTAEGLPRDLLLELRRYKPGLTADQLAVLLTQARLDALTELEPSE